MYRLLFWFHYERNLRPTVPTLQSSVFISGDLKSQHDFVSARDMTSFVNRVIVVVNIITSVISIQSRMNHVNNPRFQLTSGEFSSPLAKTL